MIEINLACSIAFKGEIPPMLCSEGDINGNGRNGIFQCDVIACATGSYSSLGFAEGIERLAFRVCHSCPSNPYLGSRTCDERFSLNTMMDSNTTTSSNALLLVLIAIISALCLTFICQPALIKNRQLQDEDQNDSLQGISDTIGSSKAVANRNQLRPLVFSSSGKLGKVDDHPLAVIEVPSKRSDTASAPPFSWGGQKDKELEDDWLAYT